MEAKVGADFEEVNVCGDPATYRIYNGYSGEGTFTVLKIDSDVLQMMADATSPAKCDGDHHHRTDSEGHQQGRARVAVRCDDSTNFIWSKFEKKAKVEEEVPFKFGHFSVLETIKE